MILIGVVRYYCYTKMIPQSENPLHNAREKRTACIILIIVIVFIGIMFIII
jgi:hypothetical protein